MVEVIAVLDSELNPAPLVLAVEEDLEVALEVVAVVAFVHSSELWQITAGNL